MDFQGYLKNTYELLKRHPFFFILGGFIAQLLTMISLSFLAGPFLGAYLMTMILFLRNGKKPEFNDLFAGLPKIRQLFSFFFLLLIIVIGFMLLILPGIVFATWWIYTLPLMADKEMKLADAMRESLHKVNEKGFFMHLIFVLMITFVPFFILNFLAALLPLLNVLKLLLPPLQTGCLVGLYLEQFENIAPSSITFTTATATDNEQVRSLPE
jgi:hypothetical protein